MEELNTLKQNLNESVASFHDRLDKVMTRIFGAMSFRDDTEKLSKIETIKELALSRFIHHSIPDISRFLRSQNLDSLSAALSKAIEEERAIRISKEEFRTKSHNSNKFCTFCKQNGHLIRDCYRKSNNKVSPTVNFNQKSTSSNTNNSNNDSHFNYKFCRYCKKRGHLIDECRKLDYKKRQNEQTPQNSNGHVNLNLSAPQVDAALVEVSVQEA